MSLVTNGIPPQLVFGSNAEFTPMDSIDRQAWLIVAGQMQGHKWDWQAWRWKDD